MLTAAQITALAANIAANTSTVKIAGVDTQIKNVVPDNGDNAFAVAAWYNLAAAVDFFGNYAKVPIDALKNAIAFKNFTPTDAVPASGNTTQITNDILNHLARTMLIQSFQINVNNLLTAGQFVDATKDNIYGAWKDACNTNMPSGASGASQKGGWSAIQPILCRKGTNAEKLFATITAVTGTGADNTHAAVFTFEGNLSGADISNAWGVG